MFPVCFRDEEEVHIGPDPVLVPRNIHRASTSQVDNAQKDYVVDLFNGYAKMFRCLGTLEQLDLLKVLNEYFDKKLRAKFTR
jgi:hypothetical protein